MGSERRQQHYKRLQYGAAGGTHGAELIHRNHKCADGGVVREVLYVGLLLADELVQHLQLPGSRFKIAHKEVVLVVEKPPELLQEAVHAVNTLGVPGLALLHRAEEHLIKTQGIGAIGVADEVGVDHIVHRLAHLFDSPAADVLAVLEDEAGVVVLGPPLFESLGVEPVVAHQRDVYVDLGGLVIVLQSV